MFSSLWLSEQYENTVLAMKVKEVLFRKQSEYQLVEISDTYDWGRVLMLDGCMMVTEKDEFFYHETISHLPMSFIKAPKSALVIGGGDGGTLRELCKYKELDELVISEIDQMVIDASRQHLPFTASGFDDTRVKILARDANEYLKECKDKSFDLITCDGSDPVGFAEILIRKEFYSEIKRVLKDDGVFITQSSSPLSQAEETKKTWKNLNESFENCRAAWSLVPSYPGAAWSFMMASKSNDFKSEFNREIPNCKFWNSGTRQGLLSLPNFLKDLL